MRLYPIWGKLFNFIRYRYRYRSQADGSLDYAYIRELAQVHRPKMVLCGYSPYPRDLDYWQFQSIADEVGALTMADISHYGGLLAGGVMDNPLDFGFDVITTTTHKSLRGPRGGLILCKAQHAAAIDKSVFPGLQGGPHMNQVAAVAVALKKAQQPEFKQYSTQILANAQVLAEHLLGHNISLVTGGTSNHLLVINTIESFGINGHQAQELLDEVGITTNKQVVPDDPLPPMKASGICIGTPAATSRNMGVDDMQRIANWMVGVLSQTENENLKSEVRQDVLSFCRQFPVPGIA